MAELLLHLTDTYYSQTLQGESQHEINTDIYLMTAKSHNVQVLGTHQALHAY